MSDTNITHVIVLGFVQMCEKCVKYVKGHDTRCRHNVCSGIVFRVCKLYGVLFMCEITVMILIEYFTNGSAYLQIITFI